LKEILMKRIWSYQKDRAAATKIAVFTVALLGLMVVNSSAQDPCLNCLSEYRQDLAACKAGHPKEAVECTLDANFKFTNCQRENCEAIRGCCTVSSPRPPGFTCTEGALSTACLDPLGFFEADETEPCRCPTTTAIELRSFTAEVQANGTVTLMWETPTEIDNAGFNLYRASTVGGPYTQINSPLIPAQGNPVAGARYSFTDSPGPGTFRYILTDVDPSGRITLHGPVRVKVKVAGE
jgi:hypothetical protein